MFKHGDKIRTPAGIRTFDRYDGDGDVWCFGGYWFSKVDCDKVENPPIPKLRDVPHAEIMYRWLTEPDSVLQFSIYGNDWSDSYNPSWDDGLRYRIKPKTITKYKWAVGGSNGNTWVTASFYKDEQELCENLVEGGHVWVQRLDQTAEEFEINE